MAGNMARRVLKLLLVCQEKGIYNADIEPNRKGATVGHILKDPYRVTKTGSEKLLYLEENATRLLEEKRLPIEELMSKIEDSHIDSLLKNPQENTQELLNGTQKLSNADIETMQQDNIFLKRHAVEQSKKIDQLIEIAQRQEYMIRILINKNMSSILSNEILKNTQDKDFSDELLSNEFSELSKEEQVDLSSRLSRELSTVGGEKIHGFSLYLRRGKYWEAIRGEGKDRITIYVGLKKGKAKEKIEERLRKEGITYD